MNAKEFPYLYRLYGLIVRSEIFLPELANADESETLGDAPVVEFHIGEVPEELEDQVIYGNWLKFNKNECLYDFEEAGRYYIEGGKTITVQRHEGAADNDVRAFLYGSAVGTLLHQRQLLPLHVSAVLTPTGVVAFTGDSGAGKSTMAGVLNRVTGWPIVSDDVAVFRLEETDPIMHCGIFRLKLWEDAVGHIRKDPKNYDRDGARVDKYHVIEPDLFHLEPVPMKALIQLERGEEFSLTEMNGAKAFETVANAIYRPYLVPWFSDRLAVTAKCAQLARKIEIFSMARRWSPDGLVESAEKITDRFSG